MSTLTPTIHRHSQLAIHGNIRTVIKQIPRIPTQLIHHAPHDTPIEYLPALLVEGRTSRGVTPHIVSVVCRDGYVAPTGHLGHEFVVSIVDVLGVGGAVDVDVEGTFVCEGAFGGVPVDVEAVAGVGAVLSRADGVEVGEYVGGGARC